MADYIYTIKQGDIQLGQEEQTRLQTTTKHEAVKFLAGQVVDGVSLSMFEVTRSRSGRVDSTVHINVYEFMKVDQGETF